MSHRLLQKFHLMVARLCLQLSLYGIIFYFTLHLGLCCFKILEGVEVLRACPSNHHISVIVIMSMQDQINEMLQIVISN